MKKMLSKEQLRDLISGSINSIDEVVEDSAQVRVSDPQWHAEDEQGRNWNVSYIKSGSEYGMQIKKVVEELRLKYGCLRDV
jgi:hypothetical protein